MKEILYEATETASQTDRKDRDRTSRTSPSWHIQVPETQAERSILTYVAEGILSGRMAMHLWCDKNKECQATLVLTGDWDNEGKLKGKVTVTHALSSEEQDELSKQLRKRLQDKMNSVTDSEQQLAIGSYPVSYVYDDYGDPFLSPYESPPYISEDSFAYFSVVFPSEAKVSTKGEVLSKFRILCHFPYASSIPVILEMKKVKPYLGQVVLPTNHFHYQLDTMDDEPEDNFHTQTSAYENGYRNDEDNWGNFHEDDIRNQFPDGATYANWIESSE